MELMKIEKIHANFNNPFKIKDEELNPLIESIRDYGIIQPLLVRKDKKSDVYEIISGHRRYLAATRLDLKELPVEVLNISKDEADILLVDSNLHREKISVSEKAFAYKMKFDALKNQGKRTDLTSDQVGPKLTAEKIADDDSVTQIKRYIRLTNLTTDLLNLADKGKIAFTVAVELSYLTKDEQNNLYVTIQSEDCTPSLSQAQQMKKLSQDKELNVEKIFEIMTKPKANQKEMLKMPMEKVREIYPNIKDNKEAEDFITKACMYYAKHLKRQKDRGER